MKNKTVLLTRHDKIGDFITALPMAKVLKEQTSCKIIFLVSSINYPLAKNVPYIDEVIVFEKNLFKMVKKIRQFGIDISISAYIDTFLGLVLFLSGIKIRIAPSTKIAQIFFNKKIVQRRSKVEKTEWEYNLDLLKAFDKNLDITYRPPYLLHFFAYPVIHPYIIFHPGFGGSSDGNLTKEDYWNLIVKANKFVDVYITFGPDDKKIKDFFKLKIKNKKLKIMIKDDFKDIWEFTKFISKSKLFVSTSTGPMHLAGFANIPTLSFFGDNLFASSKRWATISEKKLQNNFEVPKNYDKNFYKKVENRLIELIKIYGDS